MRNRLRILMVASNPQNTSKLALKKERALLRNRMRDNVNAGNCEILIEWAARPIDLQIALKNNKPHILHFAGHGNREGIWLEDNDGKMFAVSKDDLDLMLDAGRPELRLVLLNSCSSTLQLNKLREVVDYVIGTRGPIRDDVALFFTAHFYEAVAVGTDVREAFLKSQGQLAATGAKQQAESYELLVREEVDESELLIPPFVDNEIVVKTKILEGKIDFANVSSDGLEPHSTDTVQLNQKNKLRVQSDEITGELRFVNQLRTRQK